MTDHRDQKQRKCIVCKQVKSCSEYFLDLRTRDQCTAKCKVCFRQYHNSWSARNREKERARSSRGWFALRRYKKFNVTKEWYETQLQAQNGCCAICKRKEIHTDVRGRIKALAIDHNADMSKIRGLLCAECNTGIGKLRHSAEILNSAIEYLRKYSL